MNSNKIGLIWDEDEFGVRSAGVMLDEKNRVLMCKVVDDPNLDFWVLPGGGSIIHETSEETVKREFLEEANFEIDVQRLLWIEENFFVHQGRKVHGIGFYFLVSPKNASGVWEQDEFMGQEDEIDPDRVWDLIFKWFDLSELDGIVYYPTYVKEVLRNIPENPEHIIHKDYGDYTR